MKVIGIIAISSAMLTSCNAMVPYLQVAEVIEEAVVAEIQGPTSPPPPQAPGANGPAQPR